MRKICLVVVGIFIMFLHAYSQSSSNSKDYKSLNLKLEETNLVSSYYSQTGNHSAITGGVGTEQLSDVSNIIDLKFSKYDIFEKKHTFNFELGIDHHTAASSAYVSTSGASQRGGTRIYPSFNWQVENEAKRTTFGLGASVSYEYTYHSYGGNILFSKRSKNNNREFTARGNIFLDGVKMIEPSELKPTTVVTSASGRGEGDNIPVSARNTFATSFSLSQVVNKNLQVVFIADGVAQQGYLGLPFHRVYFTNNSHVKIENLPDTRFKLPVGIRLNYFAGDKVILRTYYRFYKDSWGITSQTASLEVPVKITPFISVSPFFRYYTQTAADYFAPKYQHSLSETYYTSNYEYAAFNSNYAGLNLRIAPPKGVFGIAHLNTLEIRYGYYKQTTGLMAHNISLNVRLK